MNKLILKLGTIIYIICISVAPLIGQSNNILPEPVLRNDFVENGTFIHIPGPNPIIRVASEGLWDDRILEAGNVFKDGDTYYFYYHGQGHDPDKQGYRIGVATAQSPLGPFKRFGDQPIIDFGTEGSWDNKNVACPAVLKEGEDKYYMWYWASGGGGNVGLATASNPLGPWKKYEGNPVLKSFGYVGGVVKVGEKYHMYNTYPIGSTSPDQGPICLATADKPEGPWKKYEGNPVVPQGDWGAWDDGGYSEGGMLYHEGIFHTFYAGVKWSKLESIGYAYSFDGYNFIKYGGNPVVPRENYPDAAAFAEVHGFWEPPFFYLYHTIRYTSRGTMDRTRGGEELAVQILATQKPFRIAMPVLSLEALEPLELSDINKCPPIGLENISDVSLTIKCSYTENAKAGVRLHVLASNDGINYDTEDLTVLDILFKKGKSISKTIKIEADVMFMKIKVENLDDANDVADVLVTATLGQN